MNWMLHIHVHVLYNFTKVKILWKQTYIVHVVCRHTCFCIAPTYTHTCIHTCTCIDVCPCACLLAFVPMCLCAMCLCAHVFVCPCPRACELVLLFTQESPAESVINWDMKRTFVSHTHFKEKDAREFLQKISKAYSVYDPEVGYCQGFSFIIAVLLLQVWVCIWARGLEVGGGGGGGFGPVCGP